MLTMIRMGTLDLPAPRTRAPFSTGSLQVKQVHARAHQTVKSNRLLGVCRTWHRNASCEGHPL